MLEGDEYCRKRKDRGEERSWECRWGEVAELYGLAWKASLRRKHLALGHCACCVACTCSKEWVWSRLCNPPISSDTGAPPVYTLPLHTCPSQVLPGPSYPYSSGRSYMLPGPSHFIYLWAFVCIPIYYWTWDLALSSLPRTSQ